MSYTPPGGGSVVLNLLGASTPPNADDINIEFDTVTADIRQAGGWKSSTVSTPGIAAASRPLRAKGWDSSTVPRPDAFRDVLRARPPSIDPPDMPEPTYVRWRRFLLPTSIDEPNSYGSVETIAAAGGYHPPPGSTVVLNWLGTAYTPPPGSTVVLEFGAIGLARVDSATLGSQLSIGSPVLTQTSSIAPSGWDSSAFGSHTIASTALYITCTGFDSSAYGSHTVTSSAVSILPGGIAPPPQTGPNANRQIPDPLIDFRTRYLLPTGIAAPAFPSSHAVTHDIQFVDETGYGLIQTTYGTPRIEFAVRYIEPPFMFELAFGSHNIAFIQPIAPSGWASSVVSTGSQLDINLQRVYPDSGSTDPAQYGATHVRNQHEVLRPTGWLSQDFNFPVVYNRTQQLFVGPFMDTTAPPDQWPAYYPFVANKNRVLGPSGWDSSKFSLIGNVVRNNAEAVLPSGFESTQWGAGTFIAYAIRTLPLTGWDSFYSSGYTVVYNAARVLAPTGWDSSSFGTPNPVLNLNRTVKHVFPYAGETVGTAFIAYRVRSVFPGVFIEPPNGIPELRYDPYPIAPAGIAPPQFGGHTVYEHFNIISPVSVNVHPVPWVGEPIVENENKTIRVAPSEQSLYGVPTIFNYVQYKQIGGYDLTVFGSHLISYRTKYIYQGPMPLGTVPNTHQVRNLTPDPPGQQYVLVDGIDTVFEYVPRPVINTRTINVPSLGDMLAFGSSKVTTNRIFPTSIYDDGLVGTPSIPFPRDIAPLSIPTDPMELVFQVSQGARFNPFHIYAPLGDARPDGYHPNQGGSLIGVGEVFGTSVVSNQNRTIGPVPDQSLTPINRPTEFGDTVITLFDRQIFPHGIMSMRVPAPVFLNVPQYIVFGGDFNEPGIESTLTFGSANIAHVVVPEFNRTLHLTGIAPIGFGQTTIELKNRTIAPQGIPHRGNPEDNLTNPWGLPLIGFPRVYVIGAGLQTLWGTHVIEYKNRTYVGWGGFTSNTFDIDGIDNRIAPMRVSRRNPEGGIPSIQSSEVFGSTTIGHAVRTILDRSIYPGVPGTPRMAWVISPAGIDSLVVGDIDRWEAGKIKAHGDDMSEVGFPRMMRRVIPDGIENINFLEESKFSTQVKYLSTILVAGMPPIGFDGPSVTNPFGCTNRVVVPLPILSAESIPNPTIENVDIFE